MKQLEISHIDLDGVGCIVVSEYFGIEFDEILMMNYNEYEQEDNTFDYDVLKNYDKVIYTDFSPDKKSLDILKAGDKEVVVIDHHSAVHELVSGYDYDKLTYIYSDENLPDYKSGTELFFDYLLELNPMRVQRSFVEFVKLVTVYDTWQEDHELWELATDVNRYLWKLVPFFGVTGLAKYATAIEKFLSIIEKNSEFGFNKIQQLKITAQRDKEDMLLKKALKTYVVRKDGAGNKYGLCMMDKGAISVNASRILHMKPDIKYLGVLNTYKKDDIKLSLRSKKDRDFSLANIKYAKGHDLASGFETPDKDFYHRLWTRQANFEII